MRGIVFTEFMSMVSDVMSEDMVDDIIEDCDLPNGGAYTQVGTYPHEEILALVTALSQRSGISVHDLCVTFGQHLFNVFATNYKSMFEGYTHSLDFLESIDQRIHGEVRKLYPDAELPKFEYERGDGTLKMRYMSKRPFGSLCIGLVDGCKAHFGDDIEYSYVDHSPQEGADIEFDVRAV